MSSIESTLGGKWNEFKGEIRKMWGNLTDDELEQSKGNIESIGGIVQQKYGKVQSDVKQRFDEVAHKFGHKAVEATDAVKNSLKNETATESVSGKPAH